MYIRNGLFLAFMLALSLVAGCDRGTDQPAPVIDGPNPGAVAEVNSLRTLGRHTEADALATELGMDLDYGRKRTKSFKETMDAGDDPLTPGCVCCYSDAACTVIHGRSVDECFPGGDGGDDLSENIAATTCTTGAGCYARKEYSCDKVLPGSVCRLKELTCCGVATTSGYCYLDIT